jgi:hypothetical protein
LDRLDNEKFGGSSGQLYGYHPNVIDLAHVRWAAGSAVTALDLCATALGRKHGLVAGQELAIFDFFPADQRDGPSKQKAKVRFAALSPAGQRWLNNVNSDPEYRTVRRARHPFTHGRLPRKLYLGTTQPGPHEQRQGLPVGSKGAEVYSRDLITMAKHVALHHIKQFADAVKRREL